MTRRVVPRPVRTGAVSVVVTAPGAYDLGTLAALELDGDGHEVVVVSPVAPTGAISRPVRHVRVPPGTAVAVARDRGAAAAVGEHLAFLASETTPEPRWVTTALARFRADARVVAVAPVVVGPGDRVRSGGGLDATGTPVPDDSVPRLRPVLHPPTAGFVVDARAFAWVGGAAGAGAGLEDVDLGWRLWSAGFEVWCDPASRLASRVEPVEPTPTARLDLLGRNLSEPWRSRFLDVATRVLGVGGAAGVATAGCLPAERRRVRDRALWPRFGPALRDPAAPELRAALEDSGLAAALAERPRVVVVTPDVLAPSMAGPAIRATELARAVATVAEVEVVSTVRCDLVLDDLPTAWVDAASLHERLARCDAVVVQGNVLDVHPWIADLDVPIVVDLYDPIHLEVLEQSRELPLAHRRRTVGFVRDTVARQLGVGDFFLTASEKQRDLWIGHLALAGRVNATSYDGDPSLRGLIDVVPFGVPTTDPVATGPVLRGVVPGIGPDDVVLLWAGGVYNWFDPLTLVRAVDRLRHRTPSVRLVFMGMQHPHPEVPEMAMAQRTRDLADELGLVGTHVFFNEGWVPYRDRQNFLLEADLGVSTHLDHVETAYSFRTRILDYLWASLPIVATGGDGLGDVIAARGLGLVVPPGDVAALEDALFELSADPARRSACRDRIAAAREDFRWDRTAAPLVRFCADPRRAPDLLDPRETGLHGDRAAAAVWGSGWRQSARAAAGHVRRREWSEVRRKAGHRLGRDT